MGSEFAYYLGDEPGDTEVKMERLELTFVVSLAFALSMAGCTGIIPNPSLVTYYVAVRVEPFIPTNLGDRVTGPATVYVDAHGATKVEVYVQPVDQPIGGKPLDIPKLIGTDDTPEDGFATPWAADEPYPYVQVFAVAYGQPDVNYSRASLPITILLDWRQQTR